MLALVGARHIVHVSRIRVNSERSRQHTKHEVTWVFQQNASSNLRTLSCLTLYARMWVIQKLYRILRPGTRSQFTCLATTVHHSSRKKEISYPCTQNCIHSFTVAKNLGTQHNFRAPHWTPAEFLSPQQFARQPYWYNSVWIPIMWDSQPIRLKPHAYTCSSVVIALKFRNKADKFTLLTSGFVQ